MSRIQSRKVLGKKANGIVHLQVNDFLPQVWSWQSGFCSSEKEHEIAVLIQNHKA